MASAEEIAASLVKLKRCPTKPGTLGDSEKAGGLTCGDQPPDAADKAAEDLKAGLCAPAVPRVENVGDVASTNGSGLNEVQACPSNPPTKETKGDFVQSKMEDAADDEDGAVFLSEIRHAKMPRSKVGLQGPRAILSAPSPCSAWVSVQAHEGVEHAKRHPLLPIQDGHWFCVVCRSHNPAECSQCRHCEAERREPSSCDWVCKRCRHEARFEHLPCQHCGTSDAADIKGGQQQDNHEQPRPSQPVAKRAAQGPRKRKKLRTGH